MEIQLDNIYALHKKIQKKLCEFSNVMDTLEWKRDIMVDIDAINVLIDAIGTQIQSESMDELGNLERLKISRWMRSVNQIRNTIDEVKDISDMLSCDGFCDDKCENENVSTYNIDNTTNKKDKNSSKNITKEHATKDSEITLFAYCVLL